MFKIRVGRFQGGKPKGRGDDSGGGVGGTRKGEEPFF